MLGSWLKQLHANGLLEQSLTKLVWQNSVHMLSKSLSLIRSPESHRSAYSYSSNRETGSKCDLSYVGKQEGDRLFKSIEGLKMEDALDKVRHLQKRAPVKPLDLPKIILEP